MVDEVDTQAGDGPRYDLLTNRSKQVLRLVAEGLTTREIAKRLLIHDITVNNHIESAMRRLGVSKRVDAARLVALHENGGASPTIPAQRPAAINPVWRDGFLDVAPTAHSVMDEGSILAALSVLREALEDLSQKLSRENTGARERDMIAGVAKDIPSGAPTPGDVFRLGHRYDLLATLAEIAGEEWSASTYSSYAATILHFERVLKQFPSWRAFVANVSPAIEPADALPRAAQAAAELVAALGQSVPARDTVPATPALLDELAQLSDPAGFSGAARGSPISWKVLSVVVSDIVESIGNVIKALANAAVEYLKIASGSFRREIDKQAEIDGARAFHWLRRAAAMGLIGGGSTALGVLIAAHPEQFAWVAKVIQFLMRVG
jgi:DNA-binding CsgD family transcriptional regulator